MIARTLVALAVLTAGLSGCILEEPGPVAAEEIPYRILLDRPLVSEGVLVIRSAEDWPPGEGEDLTVDFRRDLVLAAGGGWGAYLCDTMTVGRVVYDSSTGVTHVTFLRAYPKPDQGCTRSLYNPGVTLAMPRADRIHFEVVPEPRSPRT